jgi:recombination protein RecA
MASDVKELVKAILDKTDSLYVPKGKVTWRLPTGIPSLDKILGGGLPGGSIVQVYGPPGCGKTSLVYAVAGQAVKLGYKTLFVPLEGFSNQYAEACGIDIKSDNFVPISADYAEQIFNFTVEAVRNYDVKVVVMDSISAAVPKENLDKKQKVSNLDKGLKPGEKARLVGHFIEQLQAPVRRKEILFVTVNQLRSDIGKFVSGLKPGGGMALQYYSDIKISLWGKNDMAKQEIETSVRVDKGKDWDVIPFGVTTLYFHHAKGVDIERDILTVCEKVGIVKKSGSWYSYIDSKKKEQKYQGLDNFTEALRNNSALREELLQKATVAAYDAEIRKDGTEESEDGSVGTTE